ncbi:unnamed protein product [Boreogadus saida]
MTLKEGGLGARSDLMVELLTLMYRIEQAGELVGFFNVPQRVCRKLKEEEEEHQHCQGGERSLATQTLLTSFPPPRAPSVPRNNSTAGSPTLTDCSSGSPSVDIQPEPGTISVKENMEPVMSAGQGADQIREVGDEVTNILQRTEVKVQWGSGSYVLLGLVTFVTSFAVMYLYQQPHLDPRQH